MSRIHSPSTHNEMPSKNQTTLTAEPGKQDFVITREFEAPRELVFKAFTDSKLLVRWLGPRNLSLTLERFEPKNGGSYRYINADKDGNKFAFHGVFHEIMPPERTIQTFEFEGLPEKGHVSLDMATFEALPGGRSRLTIQSVFKSVTDRDGMIASGMEKGVNEGHERLDELIANGILK
jgi:uncharacterized protein YndB with AHSA1/START domain